ncbi:MAG: hypothetical protein AB7N71_09860, partial [Phycisphaerae bacterium]
DRASAIRNECRVCHADTSMAGHGGAMVVRGNISESLSCESCHMPYATKNVLMAAADAAGSAGRIGDVRSHVFRIDVRPQDFLAMFSADGTEVVTDGAGRAAVTVDFVCLRCHNGTGNVFELTVDRAAEIAGRIHELP